MYAGQPVPENARENAIDFCKRYAVMSLQHTLYEEPVMLLKKLQAELHNNGMPPDKQIDDLFNQLYQAMPLRSE
jgi:hypothetical protein